MLRLYVQPGASNTGVAGEYAERVRIRVRAPAQDGRANSELCRFLAEEFEVPRKAVVVEKGSTARKKLVSVRAPRRYPAWLPRAD